jgi:hypothetical protein
LNLSIENLKQELKFAALFIVSGVWNIEISLQLFSDILSGTDGTLTGPRRKANDP